ncbi:MAG: hypothetical protein AAB880_01330 [Patescibacteria group bacterium]
MLSGKDIRNRGLAASVPANEPNPAPPQSQISQQQPLAPVQPVAFQVETESEKKPWWAYVLAFLFPILILALLAIPLVGLASESAWGHSITFGLFVVACILTGREQIEGRTRVVATKIIARWWAIKLIFAVWWLCTLIISLS